MRCGGIIIRNTVSTVFIGANINTNNPLNRVLAISGQTPARVFHPIIIKPITVDHRMILGQAKHPWLRVAWLRFWGDGANLGKAKP